MHATIIHIVPGCCRKEEAKAGAGRTVGTLMQFTGDQD